jgi:CubicO group peptidase (beta-lactamase class C family)
VPTLVQLLDGKPPANTAAVRVDKAPGSGFRYAGGGYAVMQLLAEDVTGRPFDQLACELVLEPLGMRHSAYQQPLAEPLARDAATAYRRDGKPIAGRWHTYPEKTAAGLWTTPTDFARIILEIQKPGNALRPETVKTMLAKSPGDYGLGFALGETERRASFQHGGANEGFRCQFFAYRDTGEGAMVMTNGDNGGALASEILRAIAVEYGWVDYRTRERAVVAVDPAVLQSYVGDYEFPGGPVVNVLLKDGKFMAGVGGDKVELLAEAPDSFFDLAGNAPPVKFVKQADGSVALEAAGGTARRKK